MTSLPEPAPIREYRNVDRATFDAEIRPAGQPAVLRGIGAHWPAVAAANRSAEAALDYLLSFGTRQVDALIGAPEIGGRFFYNADYTALNFTRGAVPLDVFFDRLLRDRAVENPFALAVQSEIIPGLLPGFIEANRLDLVDASVAPRIWLGNRIQVAPHYDLFENVGVVVLGRRRFTLFPPEQLANLYMGPLEITPAGTPVSLVDPHDPDLERFPRYAEAAAAAQSAVLEQGDGIYIPFHWWHAVDSLERVNAFVNYWWNDAPKGLGSAYDALLHAFYGIRGLPEQQRRVWRLMFDHLVFQLDGDPAEHLPPQARGVLGPVTPEQLARMRNTLREVMKKL